MTITNPNYAASCGSIRDPMIVLYEDRYYMVATSPAFWSGPNPGVIMWSSDDLADWKCEGRMIDAEPLPDDCIYKNRFWAPELFIYGGKFYITFNALSEKRRNEGEPGAGLHSFVAYSDNITGPYTICPEPLISSDTTNDAHLFADDDGKVYLFYTLGHSICAAEFSPSTCRVCGEPFTVICVGGDGEWDKIGIEGSFTVKRGGKYYHWYSSWTRGYEMGIAVADKVTGPYEKLPCNPVITAIDTPDSSIPTAGHNSCFRTKDGRDCVAYHGNAGGKPESLCLDEIGTYPPTRRAPAETFEA